MFRTALALLASMALAAAQTASDSAAEGAQASPSPSPTPEAEASPTPDASPAAEASPSPEATPAAEEASPSESPAPPTESIVVDDIIPLPDAGTESGAPLDTEDIMPVAPLVDDASFVDPNAFVTDELPPAPPAGLAVAESALERQRKERIRYRDVRVEAEKDPQIVAMKKRSDDASAPEAQRAALREYYRMVAKKISEIDPTLTGIADSMAEAYIRRMAQTRIEPTIPLEPPPTPAPLN